MSGIYIHFPFCKSKCIYCNFYSVINNTYTSDYLKSLLKEIELRHNYLDDTNVKTLYFGGGTPSLLNVVEISKILKKLKEYFSFDSSLEFTFEANPEQLSLDYLSDLKRLGVNRLSIGVQSFDDIILSLLKRKHTAADAEKSVTNALSCGFDNVSIDLIYGISERYATMWEKELQKAFALPITHLSAYSLTVEENTLLYKKIQKQEMAHLDDDHAVNDFKLLLKMSKESGFENYEISNFARNNMISRHNFAYWEGVPYLGLGPSAHSYNGTSRQWNVSNISKYIESISLGAIPCESEILSLSMRYNEYVMLRLRTSMGVSLDVLKNEFGATLYQHFLDQFSKIQKSHYTFQNNGFVLTEEGKLYADRIAATLFI